MAVSFLNDSLFCNLQEYIPSFLLFIISVLMRFNEEKYGKLYQRKSGDTASQKMSNFAFALFLGNILSIISL